MSQELLPTKATYRPDEPVIVEAREVSGTLRVLRFGEVVAEYSVDRGLVDLGLLPAGGYGIELGEWRTAVEVTDSPVMRYGFVVNYLPERDVRGVADNVRRLHLTDVQFYDWAYRHADLLGGGETYADALDQPISLTTVRRLINAVQEAGARALGYAAVYGVGNAEWARWKYAALLRPGGEPYGLGDFLSLVDPAEPGWLTHFVADLRASAESAGFDGFHLDQYGYPKFARRADGTSIDVAESFATLIAFARAGLPEARLVFNNVNDFPTWRTAPTTQDAVYIEVWPPHTTLGHLATVVNRARSVADGKSVVIAAYQHVYDLAPVEEADRATAFTMATLYSHGATQLLCGEADRILVDPYYVRNHVIEASTAALLKRWYDFLVEHGELLGLPDVTGAFAGSYNDDCDVSFDDIPVTETPAPQAIWRRVTAHGNRLVVHLINLADQDDAEWDAPRKPIASRATGTLRIRRAGPALPRVRVADPDRQASLTDLDVNEDGDYVTAAVPAPHIWQLIVIDL
ncbi:MAG TPA: glycoside hydrolase family 66 protein [Pseudonocardiaceae bacterium]|jgi:dextranase